MQFKNLTPHAVNVYNNGALVLTLPKPEVPEARVAMVSTPLPSAYGIPLFSVSYGDVTGLPDSEPGVFLVVSAMVRTALPNRCDLVSPGDLVRDADGKILGCNGFNTNL